MNDSRSSAQKTLGAMPVWADRVFVATCILFLLASCILHSFHEPMWVDELFAFDLVQDHSLTHMLKALGDQADGAPPLFYLLGRIWTAVFSMDVLSLRLFSCAAFCAAFGLIWLMLRRAFEFWPTALAVSVILGTSEVIRFEDANFRFYGLLFALIALATLLAVEVGLHERPGFRLLGANISTQAALVLCHPMGGIYSAALLSGVVLGDIWFYRRFRWAAVLSYPIGWLALLLWWRQMLHQADLNHPHSWVYVPGLRTILPFKMLLLLGLASMPWLLLRLAGARGNGFPNDDDLLKINPQGLPLQQRRTRLVLAGILLVAIHPLIWLLAHVLPNNSLFLPRYLIGVNIGAAILVSFVLSLFFKRYVARSERLTWTLQAASALVSLLCLGGLLFGRNSIDRRGINGDFDAAFGHLELPIVCERGAEFLPRMHYAIDPDRYYFLLDWQTAALPGNPDRAATVDYKLLAATERDYGDLYRRHIVDADEFLRTHPAFLVVDSSGASWAKLRLKPEQYSVTRLEPDRPPAGWDDQACSMLLVQRRM